jgi:hypothetical protein
MHCVLSIGRRMRASTRLTEAAKALATRDYVRGISRLSTLPNRTTIGNLGKLIEIERAKLK